MRRLLATLLAVHYYQNCEATKARLDSTTTNLDREYSEKEMACLEHQANVPYACRATQGCCARCHQRNSYRRQYGGGGCCGERRRARQLAVPQGIEFVAAPRGIAIGTVSAQEHGATDNGVERRDSGYRAGSRSVGASRPSEKEVEAEYAGGYGTQVENYVELSPCKR